MSSRGARAGHSWAPAVRSHPSSWGRDGSSVSQVNNVHIFPGIGMGALVAGATSITDTMMTVAADTVERAARRPLPADPMSRCSRRSRQPETSRAVAVRRRREAIDEGVARYGHDEIESRFEALAWEPGYRPLE